ncbi:cyclophilin-like fold protein [Massilimicrobiota timonensis]|uniref:cyclophilin-like fold protein n=1 Tax=Massilimicrobiota timonensis TaxID=1776392 RepID=UPI001EF724AB|nr:cyclophilin-like fold protein [Massilimicrobiota timonensis]
MKKRIICLTMGFLLMGCQNDESLFNQQNHHTRSSQREIVSDYKEKERGISNMEMIMTINNQDFTVLLEQNETTEALIKKLPMTITMKDLNANEKYYYMDNSIPANAQPIERIKAGDFMLFGDDCLVLFYENFSTSYTYTRLGQIEDVESFLKMIHQNKTIDVTLHE